MYYSFDLDNVVFVPTKLDVVNRSQNQFVEAFNQL